MISKCDATGRTKFAAVHAGGIRFSDLPSEKKTLISEFHTIRPWWNLKIGVFLIIWAFAGLIAVSSDLLMVRLLCYFIIGATIQGLGILMHEGVHRIMFRNKLLNRWVAFLCGLPALLSVTAYRVGHLPHHRHERDEKDPDELENLSRDPRALAGLFCLVFLFGEVLGFYRVGPINALRGKASERRDVLVEYTIVAAVFTAAFLLVPISILLHVWVFPALVASLLTNVRTLAEHVLTRATNRWTATRTVVSNRFVSFFMCNLNYHVEHHLFPAVPWYNLPRLHRLLGEELERMDAHVHRSYTRFLIDLGKFIAKAWGPQGKNLPLHLPSTGLTAS